MDITWFLTAISLSGTLLRQDRINGDKKAEEATRVKKQKRQESTCFHCTEQTITRPIGQNAYQRDRGMQEQTKNSI